MALHLLNRGKRWCVPGAIALATDTDYETVVRACYSAKRRVRGPRIRGVGAMRISEIRATIDLLGWHMEDHEEPGGLGTLVKVADRLPIDGRFIVRHGGHVVVVRGHDVCDTNGAYPGVWSRTTLPRSYQRRRVTHIWCVTPTQCT